MHIWAASSKFNQARLGRNLQQNTQQMLTQKNQPQSHHYWTDLEFLGELFGYLQRNLQLQTRCVERRSQPSFHTKRAVLTLLCPMAPIYRQHTVAGPVTDPKVLIEGVLFRARYLGSTQVKKQTFEIFSPVVKHRKKV